MIGPTIPGHYVRQQKLYLCGTNALWQVPTANTIATVTGSQQNRRPSQIGEEDVVQRQSCRCTVPIQEERDGDHRIRWCAGNHHESNDDEHFCCDEGSRSPDAAIERIDKWRC